MRVQQTLAVAYVWHAALHSGKTIDMRSGESELGELRSTG